MPQLSLYVDENTLKLIESGAKAAGCSLSKYVARAVKKQQGAGWPEGYAEFLLSRDGTDLFFPEGADIDEEIRKLREPLGEDAPREEL
ncbi:MAG: hypothetical protein LBT12_08495 [Oscillospiraceae bacterium]|jgi:hypothetical protein|nr:hypothetical protein [Oscillospiraceae bacterium]